jgi:hypothetical protein
MNNNIQKFKCMIFKEKDFGSMEKVRAARMRLQG